VYIFAKSAANGRKSTHFSSSPSISPHPILLPCEKEERAKRSDVPSPLGRGRDPRSGWVRGLRTHTMNHRQSDPSDHRFSFRPRAQYPVVSWAHQSRRSSVPATTGSESSSQCKIACNCRSSAAHEEHIEKFNRNVNLFKGFSRRTVHKYRQKRLGLTARRDGRQPRTAALSMNDANSISSAVTPSASWVASVTSTRL